MVEERGKNSMDHRVETSLLAIGGNSLTDSTLPIPFFKKEQNIAQASRNRSPALERAILSLGIDAGPIP